MIEGLFRDFSDLAQVEAIALGGSRAGEVFDEKSDYVNWNNSTSIIRL